MSTHPCLLILLSTAAGLGSTASTVGAPDLDFTPSSVFYYDADTVRCFQDDRDAQISLANLGSYDTTHVRCSGVFILMSRIDTLVILPSLRPVDILMISPTNQIRETLSFTLDDPHVDLLDRHPEFGDSPAESLPEFTYSPPTDHELTELRERYDLETVAGDGGEIERILNLLEWAHTIVRHDGNSQNPSPPTALNLIRVCREQDRGVNCRMMATILNEAYLAIGFKSRFITCLPYDKDDRDCHVTNIVYSKTLNKWVYVDPTFGAYFQDENGTLLNHAEIRNRLRDGGPLRLPDDMDWNGVPRDHWRYIKYMAKNLFRFSCPAVSAPGYESNAEHPVWIELLPTGYDHEKVGSTTPTGSGETYYTNDADMFWAIPE